MQYCIKLLFKVLSETLRSVFVSGKYIFNVISAHGKPKTI